LTRIQPETLNLPVQQIQLAQTTATPAPVVEQPANPYLTKVTSSVTSRTIPLIPSRSAPPPMSEPVASVAPTPLAKEPAATRPDTPLTPSSNTPPPMSEPIPSMAETPLAKAPAVTLQEKPLIPSSNTPPPMSPLESTPLEQTPPPQAPAAVQAVAAIPDKPAPEPTTADNVEKNTYKVKRNDSLWAIASRMQKDTNQPVTVIMHSIQQLNKSAFIRGNPNHIKSGAIIILPNQQETQEAPKTDTQTTVVENDDVETNKTPVLRTPTQQAKTAKTPYVRRGHLPDAKMTLVAPTLEGRAQGSATDKQSEDNARKLTQLNLQISSARERNMTLGQQISELEAKIKANDQKLALRNARLAELMQRLKNRKDAAQQNANRTPQS